MISHASQVESYSPASKILWASTGKIKHRSIILVGVQILLHSYFFHFSFILINTIRSSDVSKHTLPFHSVFGIWGHLIPFWILGCKNESLGDLGAMFAFPDPNTSSSSLLVPSSCLECKWKLAEQIPVGDWTGTVQITSGHFAPVIGLPLVSVVRFVLHVVKSSPELTYLFSETLKFYRYIIRFQL